MPDQITTIHCIGMAEDRHLRQPELIFHVSAAKTRAQIEAALDRQEHDAIEAIPTGPRAVERMIRDKQLTPGAAAALTLFLR